MWFHDIDINRNTTQPRKEGDVAWKLRYAYAFGSYSR